MNKGISILSVWFLTAVLAYSAEAAADREKLLKDPGVYGTFAVFKVDGDWWKLDKNARSSAAAEVKNVFQKHADKVATDTYLLRGLSEKADFFVRVHSTEILDNQNFLVDLMGTSLGKYLHNTNTFNGITKKLNYAPGFPEELKEALKTPPDPGPKPYVIVVPIRKDAAWWNTPQDRRTAMMKEHTDTTVSYLKTVKRKLYHENGVSEYWILDLAAKCMEIHIAGKTGGFQSKVVLHENDVITTVLLPGFAFPVSNLLPKQ